VTLSEMAETGHRPNIRPSARPRTLTRRRMRQTISERSIRRWRSSTRTKS